MALSSDLKKQQTKPEELEELLEALERLLDRTRVLYEQYFLGIQKIAPMQLHRDIERKVRELTQQQIRNTGQRFRFTTICQKFGSYSTYWKRTLREIEQGKYVRDLVRVKRKADQMGEDLPEELLVKLPKLVQDRIRRDRARFAERASGGTDGASARAEAFEPVAGAAAAPRARTAPAPGNQISEDEAESLFGEGDLDMDGLFSAMTASPPAAAPSRATPPAGGIRPVAIPLPRGITPTRPASGPDGGFRVPLPPGGGKAPAPPPRPEPAARPAARSAQPRASTLLGPPGRTLPPGMDDRQCRELYARYLKARQLVGEKNDDITYDKLVSSLGKQAATIMTEHGARGVEFHVVVRGDKVVLKAKPLKSDK